LSLGVSKTISVDVESACDWTGASVDIRATPVEEPREREDDEEIPVDDGTTTVSLKIVNTVRSCMVKGNLEYFYVFLKLEDVDVWFLLYFLHNG
jgi:hypothetical protein